MTAVTAAPRGVVWQRTRALITLVAVLLTAVAVVPGSGPTSTGDRRAVAVIDPAVRAATSAMGVVVVAAAGRTADAARAVVDAGGRVTRSLPIVDGFAATIRPRAVARLARATSIRSVTLNRTARFQELSYDSGTTNSNFARSTGTTAAWTQGNTGRGVGVAVIDSGVSNHPDLAGRVVWGPDLSGEGTTVDTYGHGTVMAGIIAGSGASGAAVAPANAYTGVAPNATIVAVKVAGRNGAVDVTTILQALHWVAAYKDQYNIRVLSLSWGVPSTQSPTVDPVNFAVERLWQLGILVVTSAGNDGPSTSITKPGDDPMVVTVGAVDDKQNVDAADDSVPSWSSRGPTPAGVAKPDLVAPGRYIIATRSYGSYVEQTYPKALYSPSYIRGSGTSESTAIVAGAAALLVAARPSLTPDQLKSVLKRSASPMPTFAAADQGAGRLRVDRALVTEPDATFVQSPISSGLGSIDASRGGRRVQTDCRNDGVIDVIQGEIDVRCEAWSGSAWTGSAWTGSAWTGSAWTGSAWTGSAWTGSAWTGSAWTGSAWNGNTYDDDPVFATAWW